MWYLSVNLMQRKDLGVGWRTIGSDGSSSKPTATRIAPPLAARGLRVLVVAYWTRDHLEHHPCLAVAEARPYPHSCVFGSSGL